jgi:hypothetical protein
MSIDEAQEKYLKRMKQRKDRAKHLLQEMNAIAKSKLRAKEIDPTVKRISIGFFVSPTTKTPKLTSQLVLGAR